MKSHRQKKQEGIAKQDKQIWKALGIERAVKKYGFEAVRHAMTKWTEYQRTNAKLLREKRELETKLAEIEGKL